MHVATQPLVTESDSVPPLLPPLLAGPAAYLWLCALPIAVMLVLNVQGYGIVAGNMDQTQREWAHILGLSGFANFVLGVVLYGVRKWFVRDTSAAWWWGLPAIIVQTAYLWFAVSQLENVLPPNVQGWIYPPERFLFYQFAFAMLPLFFGILQVACVTPTSGTIKPIAWSVGMAIAGPLILYIGALIGRNIASPNAIGSVVLATFVITLSVIMFVGIIRALMLTLRFLQRRRTTAERIAIVVIGLVLPLSGLWLNRSIPFPVDFQAWEVYALTVVNAAILVVASWMHRSWPRASFNLLCATLPFSLYFFIVFLPYTPLSILAVIVMGAGLLVLTPTLLFVLQISLLNRARAVLARSGASLVSTIAWGLLCFLALPSFFVVRAIADKAALNAALDYVMLPSIQPGDSRYTGNRINLRRALVGHRNYKDGIYYPLLSDTYSWIVFDNLVLPDATLSRLEQTFFGSVDVTEGTDPFRTGTGSFFGGGNVRDRMRMPRAAPLPDTAYLSDLQFRGARSETNPVFTLTMTLRNSGAAATEYRTTLPLPPGVFVRGFRLQVNGTLVPGRIFEKKTARWVYEMIRDSERRDPGLLYYGKQNELELQVFPIGANDAINVEIDFCAAEKLGTATAPFAANDPSAVLNGVRDALRSQLAASPEGVFFAVSASAAESLPRVEREPYLHVIIDRSEINGFTGDLAGTLRSLADRFPKARRMRVSLANYDVVDLGVSMMPIGDFVGQPTIKLDDALPCAGGLNLDFALAHALRQHRDGDLDVPKTNELPPRPIFVLLSRMAAARELDLPLTKAWADVCPDVSLEEVGQDGSHIIHLASADSNQPLVRFGASMRPLTANAATCFKATDAVEEIQFWSPSQARWQAIPAVERPEDSSDWARAASLFLRQQAFSRNPGMDRDGLVSLVKTSRDTGILIPATSYIVVENEAQWRMLELGEQQKLGQNSALEFRETPSPSVIVIAGMFGLYLYVRRRRKRVIYSEGR
jgi:hypothetical protein